MSKMKSGSPGDPDSGGQDDVYDDEWDDELEEDDDEVVMMPATSASVPAAAIEPPVLYPVPTVHDPKDSRTTRSRWRWLGVLPVAIGWGLAGFYGVVFVVGSIVQRMFLDRSGLLALWIIKTPAQFALGYGFVYGGAKFAPRAQLMVLFALAGLVWAIGGIGVFFSLLAGGTFGFIEATASMAGAATAVWRYRQSHDEFLPVVH